MINSITITASKARQKFFDLIRRANKDSVSFEIQLRGVNPVILMAKDEYEGWLETFDIMSNPDEVAAIEEGEKEKGGVPLEKLIKEFEDKDHASNSKKATNKKTKEPIFA